jgi:hypothetical protein
MMTYQHGGLVASSPNGLKTLAIIVCDARYRLRRATLELLHANSHHSHGTVS